MKVIISSNNKKIIVDDEDYEYINQWRWVVDKKGYARRGGSYQGKRTNIQLHQEIFICPKNKEIDHINGNKLDNRKENLRIATRSNNAANMPKRKFKKVTSKFKGVNWYSRTNKWRSIIKVNNKYIHLGYFKIEKEAAIAYNKAAIKYFKEFAKLNEID